MRLLFITKHGFGKCTNLRVFRTQARGGKGSRGVFVPKHFSEKDVVCVLKLPDRMAGIKTNVLLITAKGKCLKFDASQIRDTGRECIGVRVMDLLKNDWIVSAVRMD